MGHLGPSMCPLGHTGSGLMQAFVTLKLHHLSSTWSPDAMHPFQQAFRSGSACLEKFASHAVLNAAVLIRAVWVGQMNFTTQSTLFSSDNQFQIKRLKIFMLDSCEACFSLFSEG